MTPAEALDIALTEAGVHVWDETVQGTVIRPGVRDPQTTRRVLIGGDESVSVEHVANRITELLSTSTERDLCRQCGWCGGEDHPEEMVVLRNIEGEGQWRHPWCVSRTHRR